MYTVMVRNFFTDVIAIVVFAGCCDIKMEETPLRRRVKCATEICHDLDSILASL